ncbi:MAG TPA: FGGY family carbohydrate kinase [Candidatus Lokiarchaeia archaeon]|nr:FGGY family carbohydrate kinase [Candidatus Lokiarchaeia archaeon]
MKYILSIDSGSTGIRAVLFDQDGQIVAREYEKTPQLTPEPGAMEYDPELLWQALLSVSKKIVDNPEQDARDIVAMGICNQRGSFMLWDRQTGEAVTNFFGWADVRSAGTSAKMNSSAKWRLLKILTIIASPFSNFLRTVSKFHFNTDHATMRLKWLLDTKPELRRRCEAGEIAFSTVDSWFIHKLTGGKIHATDYSNAVMTAMLNPFDMRWNKLLLSLCGIEQSILPEVKDTNGDFGTTDPATFHDLSIPIRAAVGDQMAALFGELCFDPGSTKCSLGSGAFVDVNIGNRAKSSGKGLLPFIAWRLDGKKTCIHEGYIATAGLIVDWLDQGIGLSDSPETLNNLAAQCDDTEGVIFVPTNAGIQYPYFIPTARGCFFGLSISTHKCHVARAVLEGIALMIAGIIDAMRKDTGMAMTTIKVDGGVSRSDILMQCLANYANVTIERASESDMAATGVAYIAGLSVGIWKDLDDLKRLGNIHDTFEPKMTPQVREDKLRQWKKSIVAVLSVYS